MDFNYNDYFGTNPNTGYEILLYDGIMGDQTLFQRADMVEAGLGSDQPGPRSVESPSAARIPQLPRRHMGTTRGR